MEQNNYSISIMTLDDLEKIEKNLGNDFDDFWSYNIFKTELESSNSTYFVLKIDEKIIGFVGILIVLDEADITNIVIKRTHRGKGLSKLLMNYLIDFCKNNNIKKINLEVNSNNHTAINLYKNFSFIEVGCRKNYYKNGDGILFSKIL